MTLGKIKITTEKNKFLQCTKQITGSFLVFMFVCSQEDFKINLPFKDVLKNKKNMEQIKYDKLQYVIITNKHFAIIEPNISRKYFISDLSGFR